MKFSSPYPNTFFLLAVIGVLFSSCKKDDLKEPEKEAMVNTELANGMGSTTTVSGYLYASVQQQSTWGIYNTIMFATFGDPARKLMSGFNHYNDNFSFFNSELSGNINVGDVRYSNYLTLAKNSFQPNLFYNTSTSFTTSNAPSWRTDGNGSFKALDLAITRNYPVVNSFTPAPISKSSPYTVNLSGIASNYDSLIVTVSDNSSSFPTLMRHVGSSVTSVTFNTNELSSLFQNSNGQIRIFAYNYSNQTIDNKVYIFELSKKQIEYVTINP